MKRSARLGTNLHDITETTYIVLATAILLLGIATRPHGILGQLGIFLAGATILALAINKLINTIKETRS